MDDEWTALANLHHISPNERNIPFSTIIACVADVATFFTKYVVTTMQLNCYDNGDNALYASMLSQSRSMPSLIYAYDKIYCTQNTYLHLARRVSVTIPPPRQYIDPIKFDEVTSSDDDAPPVYASTPAYAQSPQMKSFDHDVQSQSQSLPPQHAFERSLQTIKINSEDDYDTINKEVFHDFDLYSDSEPDVDIYINSDDTNLSKNIMPPPAQRI